MNQMVIKGARTAFSVARNRPKIYLAGKIRKHCWRHQLVNDLREHHWGAGQLAQQDFNYVGPFFAGCDHGCYHGDGGHGNVSGCSPDMDLERYHVVKFCLDAITYADAVFCYVDAPDCHGTLVEIGWAYAKCVPVWIAFAPGLAQKDDNPMWFASEWAHKVSYDVAETKLPLEFEEFIQWLKQR